MQQQQKEQRKHYKQSIKDTALTEREFMNIKYDSPSKSQNRRAYEENLNRAENKSFFKKSVQSFLQRLKRNENINVDASNNEDLKLAFAEAIRALPLRLKTSTQLVERITGEITTTQDASDSNEYINSQFIPVIFQVVFYDQETNTNLGDEIDLREYHEGSFWKYINLSGIDLSVLQIFSDIKPENNPRTTEIIVLYTRAFNQEYLLERK